MGALLVWLRMVLFKEPDLERERRMAYDPNSNQNPELNRDRPDYENPNAYGPNAPYGGAPNPYEPSNAPYGSAPNSYGPPNAPYGSAPSSYGTPNTFYGSAPNTPYGMPETPYGTSVPPRRPLPLQEAIRELPGQYLRVITKPSTAVFAEEQGKAAWNIVWVQLIALAIITSLLVFGAINISLITNSAVQESIQSIKAASGILAILSLIFAPLGFLSAQDYTTSSRKLLVVAEHSCHIVTVTFCLEYR